MRRLILAIAVLVLLAGIVWAFLPRPVEVEVAEVAPRTIEVAVAEEGEMLMRLVPAVDVMIVAVVASTVARAL